LIILLDIGKVDLMLGYRLHEPATDDWVSIIHLNKGGLAAPSDDLI
jgi:hypothetical protein